MIRDFNEFYKLGVPSDRPLRFKLEGMLRINVIAECKGCGRKVGHTSVEPRGREMTDEQVMAQVMLHVSNRFVGCARKENFLHNDRLCFNSRNCVDNTHYQTAMSVMNPELGVMDSYKRLQYCPQLHTKTCWVGQVKRLTPFALKSMERAGTA